MDKLGSLSQSFQIHNQKATLTAVGDVTLGYDAYHLQPILDKLAKEEEKKAFDYPFLRVRDHFDGIVFCNLEGTLTESNKRVSKKFSFKARPKYVRCLSEAGFDIVSLANNHAMDFSVSGLEDTIKALDSQGIKHVGAGMNLREARQGVSIYENSVLVHCLAYSLIGPSSIFASGDSAGTAGSYDSGRILRFVQEDISTAKSDADAIVVSFHWGKEGHHYPTAAQKTLARATIDAGASVVLGHHPHVLQGIEEYKSGVIFYSLGNFMFAGNRNPSDKDSIIAKIVLDASGVVNYEVIPVKIASEQNYQPYVLDGDEKQRVLNRLKEYSSKIKAM